MCIKKEVEGVVKLLNTFIFVVLMVIVLGFILFINLLAKYL
jgi:preprotein translocase subunit SecE